MLASTMIQFFVMFVYDAAFLLLPALSPMSCLPKRLFIMNLKSCSIQLDPGPWSTEILLGELFATAQCVHNLVDSNRQLR